MGCVLVVLVWGVLVGVFWEVMGMRVQRSSRVCARSVVLCTWQEAREQ